MAKKRSIKDRSAVVRREYAPIPWRYFLVSITCGLILAAGFFYAAKQHFASVAFSMQNSEMRKTKDKLIDEQRKLKVERETVSVPANIEKLAAKMGLVKFGPQSLQYIDPNGNVTTANGVNNTKKALDGSKDKTLLASAKTKDPKAPNSTAAKTSEPKAPAATARDNKNTVAQLTTKDYARATIARR